MNKGVSNMELTANDKAYINSIATMHNIDVAIIEKNYVEMLTKSQSQKKFKELVAKIKNGQLKINK